MPVTEPRFAHPCGRLHIAAYPVPQEAIAHVKDLGREFGLPPSDSLESFFDFDEFDTDHSGVIEFPEFRVLMRTLLDVAATKLEKHPVTYTQTFVSRQVLLTAFYAPAQETVCPDFRFWPDFRFRPDFCLWPDFHICPDFGF